MDLVGLVDLVERDARSDTRVAQKKQKARRQRFKGIIEWLCWRVLGRIAG